MQLSRKLAQYVGIVKFANRTPIIDPRTNQDLDTKLHQYGWLIRAFLLKRRVREDEIWPKIHIMEGVPQKQWHHLKYQSLFPLRRPMDPAMMLKLIEQDPDQINSAYILSFFCEENFKQLLDAYVEKMLICGKAPHDESAQRTVQDKVIQWYRTFFFAEKLTPLQRQLEAAYLVKKQKKHIWFQKETDKFKKNALFCTWTNQNQRVLEDMINWNTSPINEDNFISRSWFEPLRPQSRKAGRSLMMQIYTQSQAGAINTFQKTVEAEFIGKRKLGWIAQLLFMRTYHWVRCTEFTASLEIPHDYMINTLILQAHLWLIADRLRSFKNSEADYVASIILKLFQNQIAKDAKSVNMRKKGVLAKTLSSKIQLSTLLMDLHFNKSVQTSQNPYLSIDAFVWSLILCEKIDRYNDKVYQFSEYIVQNYWHMKRHNLSDLMEGIAEFDVFLIEPKYQQRIASINPRVEIKDGKAEKGYYYNDLLQQVVVKQNAQEKYSFFDFFLEPYRRFKQKYRSIKTMDHYDRMEEIEKQNLKEEEKSPWKSQQDMLKQIDEDFEAIKLKRMHRRENSNFKE